ncbi:MAG: LacI family DNA-binding transcriptional regulator [Lachnospiraceae bacterium]|nr:LacI family DNA-binding transcriptional regulator [Lachnospiraceae bacterium]
MISMKELAAACGVSIATVSKALNDQKDVSAKTKERIRKKARELGYFPNSAAKALKTNRTYNIGVLFIDEAQSGLTHDYFAHILDSFKRKIEESGYDLTLFGGAGNFERPMTLLERTRYRGFDGVVIACIDFSDPQVLELVNSDVPVVTIDYIYNNRIAVMSDNVKGMRDLLQYVYRQGHRKIAYIHGADSSVTKSRISSFYTTASQLGLDIPEEYIREAAYRSTEEARQRTEELLSLQDPPTCILYPDDFAMIGGINAIRDRGMSIPDDISIAGYDGLGIGRHMSPPFTSLWQDTDTIGKYAADKLIELIEHPRSTIIQPLIVEGSLIEGGTVKQLV